MRPAKMKPAARAGAAGDEAKARDSTADTSAATPAPQAPAVTALATIAGQIQAEHKAAQRCASEAVAHAIRAGELLIEAKAALPHGAFGAWLAANVEFSDRTARGYMQLAGLDEAKRQRVAVLSLREAMGAIADKREPAQARSRANAVNAFTHPGLAFTSPEPAPIATGKASEPKKAPKPESKCVSVKDLVDDYRKRIAKDYLALDSLADRGEFLKRVNAILQQYAGEYNKEAREERKPDSEADDAPKPAKTGKANKVLKEVEARLNAMFNNRGAE